MHRKTTPHPSSCPACGGSKFADFSPASFLAGDERTIIECQQCQLGILWPLPSPDEIQSYYSLGYYDFNRHGQEGKGYSYARLLTRIKPKGSFLDVGCATGFFINGINNNCAWQVAGVEIGPAAAAYARDELGLEIKTGPLAEAKYPDASFDYVHVNNVLEHVTDPTALLRECRRVMKPDATLYLAIPNGLIDRQGYHNYYSVTGQTGLSKDGHLFFFSSESLKHLLSAAGLSIKNAYGCDLKRALRTRGFWPRKRNWKDAYRGRGGRTPADISEAIVEGRAYPPLYYLYKGAKERVFRWPGLPGMAYDYNIYMSRGTGGT